MARETTTFRPAAVLMRSIILATLSSCGGKTATIAKPPVAASPSVSPSASNATEEVSATANDTPADGGIAALLQSCGVTEQELNDPTTVLFEKDFTAWPKVYHGNFNAIVVSGTYVVSVTTKLHVKATLAETRQTTDFDVTGTPDKAVTQAKETAAPNKGTTISRSISTEERTKLGSSNRDWNGILCAISGTKSMVVDKGGSNRVYSFDPPLPSAVSPRASAARLQTEIGAGRTFSNIVLTVDSSTDAKTAVGRKITGSVTITPMTPRLTLQVGATGQQTTIQTDVAYKIETDFGGPQATAALGFMPMTAMYISTATKSLRVIVGDTGDPDLGLVVLSDGLPQ